MYDKSSLLELIKRKGKEFPEFDTQLYFAYKYYEDDPQSSLTKVRIILEQLVAALYIKTMSDPPRKRELGEMLNNNQFTRHIDSRRILSRMNAIRDISNLGPHGEEVLPIDAMTTLYNLIEVLDWYKSISTEHNPTQDSAAKQSAVTNDLTNNPLNFWSKLNEDSIKKIPQQSEKQLFYEGGSLSPWHVVKHSAFRRKVTDQAISALQDKDIVLLTGAGGEGKTTCIRQIAIDFFENGYVVYDAIKTRIGKLTVGSVQDILRQTNDKILLIIDKADEAGRNNLKDILQFISEQPKAVKLLLAARANEWASANIDMGEFSRIIEHIELGPIDRDEARELAELLIAADMASDCDDRNLADRLMDESNQFLLAAMLVATHGADLKQIVFDIVKRVSGFENGSKLLIILAAVAYLETGKFDCKAACSGELFRQLIKGLSLNDKKVRQALKLEVLNLEFSRKVTTRHPAIAELICTSLQNDAIDFSENEALFLLLQTVGQLTCATAQDNELLIKIPLYWYQHYGYDNETIELLRLATEVRPRWQPTWLNWIDISEQAGRLGSYDEPNSTRFLFNRAVELGLKPNDFTVWKQWIAFEQSFGQIGTVDRPYSVRWLHKKYSEQHDSQVDAWLSWSAFEKTQKNIGSIHEPYTARWIYNEALKYTQEAPIWLGWAQLEIGEGNIGSAVEAGTARWLYNEALKYTSYEGVWLAWAQLETGEGNIGTVNERGSARWIYNEALKHTKHESLWLGWAQLEIGENNIGSAAETGTARWIYNEALKYTKHESIWLGWARLEASEKNIGSPAEAGTARWIYNEALKYTNNFPVQSSYARFEALQRNVGTLETEGTARYIYHQTVTQNPNWRWGWANWAALEAYLGNVGNEQIPYSSRWLIQQDSKNNGQNNQIWAYAIASERNLRKTLGACEADVLYAEAAEILGRQSIDNLLNNASPELEKYIH